MQNSALASSAGLRADFDLMYDIVAPKWGFPLGVATRLMVTPLARSATTRGPHLEATLRAEFLWGAVLGERNAAWYSKQATNNDAMRPKETQRYRTLSRNPL